MRFLRILCVVLAISWLSGCSAIRVVYNQADTVLYWTGVEYFDLDHDQKDVLRGHIDRFHTWHRTRELAEYVALLEVAKRRFDTGIARTDVAWAVDSVKGRYRAIVDQTFPDIAPLLATLTDEQVRALGRRFEKVNRDYDKDYRPRGTPEEQIRRRAKLLHERIEHWSGPLTSAQEARLAELAATLPLIAQPRLQDRLRRQREILEILALRKDRKAFEPRLRDFLVNWDRTRPPEYEAQVTRYSEASANVYVAVYAMLTPEQKTRVSNRLQRYIDDFRALAAQGVPAAAATSAPAGPPAAR